MIGGPVLQPDSCHDRVCPQLGTDSFDFQWHNVLLLSQYKFLINIIYLASSALYFCVFLSDFYRSICLLSPASFQQFYYSIYLGLYWLHASHWHSAKVGKRGKQTMKMTINATMPVLKNLILKIHYFTFVTANSLNKKSYL